MKKLLATIVLITAIVIYWLAHPSSAAEPSADAEVMKITTPLDEKITEFINMKKLALMISPREFRIAEVISVFNQPVMAQNSLAVGFAKIAAYDCKTREATLIKSGLFDSDLDPISITFGTGAMINANEQKVIGAELDAICKIDKSKFKVLDGLLGASQLKRLFEGPINGDTNT